MTSFAAIPKREVRVVGRGRARARTCVFNWLLGFCEWRDTVITMRLSRGTRAWLRSVMGSVFTNIAFDALNRGSCDHRNGIPPSLDRDPIRVLEPITVGIRILDSLGRSGRPGILEVDLDHISLCIMHPALASHGLLPLPVALHIQ